MSLGLYSTIGDLIRRYKKHKQRKLNKVSSQETSVSGAKDKSVSSVSISQLKEKNVEEKSAKGLRSVKLPTKSLKTTLTANQTDSIMSADQTPSAILVQKQTRNKIMVICNMEEQVAPKVLTTARRKLISKKINPKKKKPRNPAIFTPIT